MNKKKVLLFSAAMLALVAISSWWWLGPCLKFVKPNSEIIQGLESLIQIVIWIFAIVAFVAARLWGKPDPATPPAGNAPVNSSPPAIVVQAPTVTEDAPTLLRAYLNWVVGDCAPLKLKAIDQGAARSGKEPLGLTSVYVDLNLDLRIPAGLSLQEYLDRRRTPSDPMRREPIEREALEREKETRLVPVLEALAFHHKLVLLGAPGSGKSTLTAYLALSLAQAALDEPGALDRLGPGWKYGPLMPVRVVLRQFAASLPKNLDQGRANHLADFIQAELVKSNLSDKTAACLRKVAQESGALFLLDGLDEAPEQTTRARVLEAVAEFARTAGKKCRFLLTTRPYAWEDFKREIAGGSESPALLAEMPFAYRVAEFEAEQIKSFITRWYQAIEAARWIGRAEAVEKEANLQQAVQREDLMVLARNPLLLTLMVTLHSNRARLPDDRADLYNEVVELLLQRWNENIGADRGLLDALNIPTLKLADLRDVMQQLAFDAHAAHAGKQGMADIPESDLVAGLRPLLGNSADKAELALDYIEKRAGLLLGQGQRGRQRQYTFPHRTFQEYLAACYLAGLHDFCQRAADLARENPAHWREVLTLAARHAKAGRGVPAADALIRCQSVDEWSRMNTPTEQDWRAAVLAGEQLLEIGRAAVESRAEHRAVQGRVGGWILAAMERSRLPAQDRANAGGVLAKLGDPRLDLVPGRIEDLSAMEFCYVPPGPFVMGETDERHTNESLSKGYWLARYPVSVAQFNLFVRDGGYRQRTFWIEAEQAGLWTDNKFKGRFDSEPREGLGECPAPFNLPNHPIVQVTWYEALAFCRWLTARWRDRLPADYAFGLPSEAEWEKAARGGKQILDEPGLRTLVAGLTLPGIAPLKANPFPERAYPWGDDFDAEKLNCDETSIGATSALGCFVDGASPFGIQEMCGNVWEWTRSLYQALPYNLEDGRENIGASPDEARVLRGGAFDDDRVSVRCAYRNGFVPGVRFGRIGFRVVASPFCVL